MCALKRNCDDHFTNTAYNTACKGVPLIDRCDTILYSIRYGDGTYAYVKNGKYCVVNNTYEPQDTTVYTGDGSCFDLHLDTNEIKWYSIEG